MTGIPSTMVISWGDNEGYNGYIMGIIPANIVGM
jgi:hypothetical protein